jgi:HK97 family phage major capsid protein/HK97 family phage prohead protease
MPLRRAWAVLTIKSANDDARTIEGIATTPSPDRLGDIVDPIGAQFALPLPLLWQHNQREPIGEVTAVRVGADAIHVTATIAKIDDAGRLRDRLDEAWQSIKSGLVRGLSIGFKPIEAAPIKGSFAMHVKKWEWAELSVVTVPQNVEASILTVKQFDIAASGVHTPGVSGLPVVHAVKGASRMGVSTADQISEFEATRAAKHGRMVAIMAKAADEHVTLDASQTSEYDELDRDVQGIDDHLKRLRDLDKRNLSLATPVPSTPSRVVTPITVKANVPAGTAFVRLACAMLVCKGNRGEAAQYAERWKDTTPEVALSLKAAIAPGTTTDAAWAGPLVNQNIASEFLELLRPATILGKIPGLRTVPFNTKVPSQTAGGTYGWVGEAKPKPVTKLAFSAVTLDIAKAAGIIVLTEELVRLSNPSAEALVRADMIAGIAQFLDQQFIDPAVAAVAGVNPASITNGAPNVPATADPLADLLKLMTFFATANQPLAGVTLIMSEVNALALGFTKNPDGTRAFPNVGVSGGTIEGITVVASQAAGTNVIALQPSLILYADDGGVTIDASREASLQMDSAPVSPADATTVLVSLWQNNYVGLRAERFVNWKRANNVAVTYLTAAAYPAAKGGAAGDPIPQP